MGARPPKKRGWRWRGAKKEGRNKNKKKQKQEDGKNKAMRGMCVFFPRVAHFRKGARQTGHRPTRAPPTMGAQHPGVWVTSSPFTHDQPTRARNYSVGARRPSRHWDWGDSGRQIKKDEDTIFGLKKVKKRPFGGPAPFAQRIQRRTKRPDTPKISSVAPKPGGSRGAVPRPSARKALAAFVTGPFVGPPKRTLSM